MKNIAIRTLETLRELCGDEGYKIVDAKDILSRIEDMDADSLFETIDILDTEQLVAVKYSDKTEYCLSITKTGILKAEERLRRQQEARESERIERLRREQAERERMQQLEAESKNKRSAKAYRKKEREPVKDERESVAVQDISFDTASAESDAVSDIGDVLNEPMHARQATLVLREVMLNRKTMRLIAKVAFFSGLIGAAIGSLIISLIFVFL